MKNDIRTWIEQSGYVQANIRLIGAAPELLEAARAMRAVAAMAESELYEGEAARAWQQLNAAIKKAEGSIEL